MTESALTAIPSCEDDYDLHSLSCEEAQQLLVDAATRLEAAIGGDPSITGASAVSDLEARLSSAVAVELQQMEGIEVSPDCG